MSTSQSLYQGLDLILVNKLQEVVQNAYSFRNDILGRMQQQSGLNRRDIDNEVDWPKDITIQGYRDLFDRFSIAERVVSVYPKECFQVQPTVFEKEGKKVTPFEEAWDNLGKCVSPTKSWYQDERGSVIWSYLLEADIKSGIGAFGLLMIGVNDGLPLHTPARGVGDSLPKDVGGLSQDAGYEVLGTDAMYHPQGGYGSRNGGSAVKRKNGVTKGMGLTFLKVFDESLVQVAQYEGDITSPRFGQPVLYNVTINDPRLQSQGLALPTSTVRVHWSRVVHIAEGMGVFSPPRMKVVLNNLLDLRKLYGGSAEMFWRGGLAGHSLETHPQLGGDVIIDKTDIRRQLADFYHGLQRSMVLSGMSMKSLAPQVSDPTSQINAQIEAICIQLGCPIRIFKGSERGELASGQDDAAWNDRIKLRQDTYITPRIICPFVDRLISLGVLPEPVGYSIEWPDLESNTKKDKAVIALTITQAMAQYVGGSVENLVTPIDFLTRILGYNDEEAQAILEAANKANEEKMEEQQSLADEQGFAPVPPPGFKNPEPEVPIGEEKEKEDEENVE